MLCSELLQSDVVCCFVDDTCQSAARSMRDRDIGFLPVCDRDSKAVVGTVTDRDLAIRLVATGGSGDTRIDKVMTRESVTCRPSDDIRTAEKAMSEHQKARIICVDERGVPVGVISFADLVRQRAPNETAATLKNVKAEQPMA